MQPRMSMSIESPKPGLDVEGRVYLCELIKYLVIYIPTGAGILTMMGRGCGFGARGLLRRASRGLLLILTHRPAAVDDFRKFGARRVRCRSFMEMCILKDLEICFCCYRYHIHVYTYMYIV